MARKKSKPSHRSEHSYRKNTEQSEKKANQDKLMMLAKWGRYLPDDAKRNIEEKIKKDKLEEAEKMDDSDFMYHNPPKRDDSSGDDDDFYIMHVNQNPPHPVATDHVIV